MESNYDFSKGIKNPYSDKMRNGYSVKIHFDCKQQDEPQKSAEEMYSENETKPALRG